ETRETLARSPVNRLRVTSFLIAAACLCDHAFAQVNTDVCKQTNTTILLVQLETGFKEVFTLARDGDTIKGTAQTWQSNGITAGRGVVRGYFGGTVPQGKGLVLYIVWRTDRTHRTLTFKGIFMRARARGVPSI